MVGARSIPRLPRSDPLVARVIRDWRALTGGGRDAPGMRRTLIACSGGADSSALAICLTAASDDLVIGHIVHDMRAGAEAAADRDSARSLAEWLGAPFCEDRVEARPAGGNLEAKSRRMRYIALASLAEAHGCRFVATAHHLDDQLETVLLRMLRGAGPRGLGGIASRRMVRTRLGGAITIVRPMLGVHRRDTEAICGRAGWSWRHDVTNEDVSRDRAFLRSRVLPLLAERFPRGAERAGEVAALQAMIADCLAVDARRVRPLKHDGALEWSRAELKLLHPVHLGEVLRSGWITLQGNIGLDRLSQRSLRAACTMISDSSGAMRRVEWAGVELVVTRSAVMMRRKDAVHGT
ncbi:MAG: tRNA lysidine(34) synthetase TilS [Phycisphaeraceae bacterium]|nr:tRNA lysidine(34) synthetase TilS [Phycisphaeraceae bacterium]MCW5755296.1 tRNA lysidine(34) synthetase TilS [Phycisphaeraceae bacterium]